ncbi:MAG: hypothetical protein JWO03_335 [Bacteroidetes bacterium]|nr:hypothetical protein [Bacteroidota bacterium]
MKRNTYVIGDIHGALRALKQLMERVNPLKNDKLIFLGDYVDGWSESAQVIEYLIQLQKEYECIFIKGNHDAWCEKWLENRLPDEMWLKNSGSSTVMSYSFVPEQEKEQHLAFLRNTKMYETDGQNRLFIHAGYTSMHGPSHETYSTNYYWDRTLWEMAVCMDKRVAKDSKLYPKRLLLYKEIFIGHTPTLHYDIDVPMQGCNIWNIDTGAGFSGKLTAMNIDNKEFWQSDTCESLYPAEKGRNK